MRASTMKSQVVPIGNSVLIESIDLMGRLFVSYYFLLTILLCC